MSIPEHPVCVCVCVCVCMCVYIHTYIHTFKLNYGCSTNQAEQLAIANALELIHDTDIAENTPRTIGIFTDSRITTDSIKNANNHS